MDIRGRWATKQVWIGEKELQPEPSLHVRNHSPTGFSWGYNGTGPEQLALALLLELTDAETARCWYQDVTWKVIAQLPRGDFTMDVQRITEVIDQEMEEAREGSEGKERQAVMQPAIIEVDYRYTREELQELFDTAHGEHIARGGRYEVHTGTLTIYTDPRDTEAVGAGSTRMGSFAAAWGQGNQIWQVELEAGFSLDDLLEELGIIEQKALGRKIHGL